jgi:shikimate 5-dehydrogenase
VIEVDDEVFFLADRRDIRTVMSELRRLDKPVKRVFIAGGGNIGRSLAKALEAQFSVKILERSRDRAKGIAEDLRNSIVLVGDAPTRICCARRTSTRPMCTARSPTTTKPTSCRRCWPSAWAASA